MSRNELKNIWSRGETAVGMWATSGSPVLAEAMALAGPDFIVIDAQHGFLGPDATRMCLLAVARTAPTPVVRVPSCDAGFIGQMLDAGAHGVIVPMIETSDDARRAVAACRMPPVGDRSFGPVRAAQSFGRDPSSLSDEVLCIVMIETAKGVENVEAIVEVPGVDAVCLGPADLAISYGLAPSDGLIPGVHADGCERIRKACLTHGMPAGMPCANGNLAREMASKGYRMVTVGSDLQLASAAARAELGNARS
jgi:4-hydroxy-2-oxoheptanedioate aldolase